MPPVPLSAIRLHLEKQLGAPIDTVFESLSEEALAAASLAQASGWELGS